MITAKQASFLKAMRAAIMAKKSKASATLNAKPADDKQAGKTASNSQRAPVKQEADAGATRATRRTIQGGNQSSASRKVERAKQSYRKNRKSMLAGRKR